jgi:hypothetical protein
MLHLRRWLNVCTIQATVLVQQDAKVQHWDLVLKEMESDGVQWIRMALDRDQRLVLMITVMEVRST